MERRSYSSIISCRKPQIRGELFCLLLMMTVLKMRTSYSLLLESAGIGRLSIMNRGVKIGCCPTLTTLFSASVGFSLYSSTRCWKHFSAYFRPDKNACRLVRALVVSWLSVLSIGYVFSRPCHKCQPFLRLKQASYFPIYVFKFLPPWSTGSGFFSFRGSHWWHVFSHLTRVSCFPAFL